MRTSIPLLLGGVALLAALPLLLSAGLLNASVQMLIAALFASAYSLLAGRAGMLSFGHAAYFGVGAFATVHAMNALGGTGLLPTPLLPLVGAAAGLVFGVVAGWFATQRTGTAFAMITLAIAELLHSLAPQLKGWFGGESGISAMRMPAWGLGFGTTTHVYYLTLVWVLAALALLYFHSLTPMGRLTLALRENEHRLRFLGYDVHGLGVSAFALSGMFSGVAGALQVIGNEAANYVVFDAGISATVVLNSYIGGVTAFLGPALGAALMTFFGYAVSDATQAWLLYQGVLFVLVMMFMPNGLVGLTEAISRMAQRLGLRALPLAVGWVFGGLLLAAGGVFLIELLQRLCSQDYRALARMGEAWPAVKLFGRDWAPSAPGTWAAVLLPLAGGAGLLVLIRSMQRRWMGEESV
jgi:branched-chain amino acid transport system permease protein